MFALKYLSLFAWLKNGEYFSDSKVILIYMDYGSFLVQVSSLYAECVSNMFRSYTHRDVNGKVWSYFEFHCILLLHVRRVTQNISFRLFLSYFLFIYLHFFEILEKIYYLETILYSRLHKPEGDLRNIKFQLRNKSDFSFLSRD